MAAVGVGMPRSSRGWRLEAQLTIPAELWRPVAGRPWALLALCLGVPLRPLVLEVGSPLARWSSLSVSPWRARPSHSGAAGGLLAEGDPEGGPGAMAALQHLSLLGGVDKPVAGGARTRSVGGQLLLKPLTRSTPPLESVLHC